jgi:hypothetical protein
MQEVHLEEKGKKKVRKKKKQRFMTKQRTNYEITRQLTDHIRAERRCNRESMMLSRLVTILDLID